MKDLSLQIASCDTSVQQMNGTIKGLTSDLSNEKERVDEHQDDIKKLQNHTTNQTTRLNVTASDEEKIKTDIFLLNGDVDILANHVKRLNLEVKKLEENIENCCS